MKTTIFIAYFFVATAGASTLTVNVGGDSVVCQRDNAAITTKAGDIAVGIKPASCSGAVDKLTNTVAIVPEPVKTPAPIVGQCPKLPNVFIDHRAGSGTFINKHYRAIRSNAIAAYKFTAPSEKGTRGIFAANDVAHSNSGYKTLVITKCPGDVENPVGTYCERGMSGGGSVRWSVGAARGRCALDAGQTYYVNYLFRSRSGANTCSASSCTMLVSS